MAHTVVGIDLGAHAVKFSLVEAGFRQSRPRGFFAELVEPGEMPLADRQAEALRRGLDRLPPESTIVYAMPGELLTMRVLELPFSDPRKVDQVVGYELEGQIVHALTDVVYDHQPLRAIDDAEGGTSVLVVAARLDDVGNLLTELAAQGVDPRALYPAPLIYETLIADEPDGAADAEVLSPCRIVLDVGHLRTNLCVLQGTQATFGRTILRGGAGLTTAIAAAFACAEEIAEEIKLTRARLGASATDEAVRLDAVLREALVPLMRDVRQTLASVRARVRTPIQAVLLTGGSAGLPGLPEYLAAELDLPVTVWDGMPAPTGPVPVDAPVDAIPVEPDSRFALATAAAWGGAGGARRIDLRRGPFVYKANLSILRQKAVHLGALAAAVVLAVTIDATMALGRLRGEREQLHAQLRAQTVELFGQERLDGPAVTTALKRSFKDEMAPIPKMTAYDLLGEISRKVPPGDDVKVDITELDIAPKKIFMRGTVNSATAGEELQTKLKTIECVEDISAGPSQQVSGGTARSFAFTIATKC